MTYKASRYNILHKANKKPVIFNSRTTACLVLDDEEKHFKWLLAQSDKTVFNTEWKNASEKLREELLAGGFVVDAEFDEYKFMRIQQQMHRYSKRAIGLTILPTLRCNLACKYCYEEERQGSLSKKARDQIVTYVKNVISEGAESLHISWYGGEPLLELNTIINLSKRFLALCRRHNVTYKAGITTNGTLLTPAIAHKLKNLGVFKAQVTIDGPPDVHNKRRPFKGGRGSFDAITKHLEELSHIFRFGIRINVDKENLEQAKEVADLLSKYKLHKDTYVYYAPVHSDGKGCQDAERFCKDHVMTSREFAKIETDLFAHGEKKGIIDWELPDNRPRACAAVCNNAFVVEPDGTLQKCFNLIGYKDEAVGSLDEGLVYNKKHIEWLTYEPFETPKCKKCKIMPLCWGGCINRTKSDPTTDNCRSLRHNINQVIERIAAGPN